MEAKNELNSIKCLLCKEAVDDMKHQNIEDEENQEYKDLVQNINEELNFDNNIKNEILSSLKNSKMENNKGQKIMLTKVF